LAWEQSCNAFSDCHVLGEVGSLSLLLDTLPEVIVEWFFVIVKALEHVYGGCLNFPEALDVWFSLSLRSFQLIMTDLGSR